MSRQDGTSMLHAIEESLHPYVKFLILPLFAFANAGIPLDGFAAAKLMEPLPLGIAAGLVIGKPLGILLVSALAIKTGLAKLPDGCNWQHMAGIGCLAGIGFTMSLFIGGLAFEAPELQTAVRVGVVAGSVISTALGIIVLLLAKPEKR
jgi:NhaA family Na+:H+ antiporter